MVLKHLFWQSNGRALASTSEQQCNIRGCFGFECAHVQQNLCF